MKKYIIATACVCLAVLVAVSFLSGFWEGRQEMATLKVGFLYESDESTPYTYNFMRSQSDLEAELGSQVQTLSYSNVHGMDIETPLRDLVRQGCGIIFTNVETERLGEIATEYPQVQFCQQALSEMKQTVEPDNYHTFNGEIYQARYISGVVAGMKLREMLDNGKITPQEAKVGFIGAFHNNEVVSSYTAFLLGIHTVAPEATMRVKYINVWDSYSKEKKAARELIAEGCVMLAQYVDTVGIASACQEAATRGDQVYHIGFHQSMVDVAPAASLISIRDNYSPYVIGAVKAVMNHQKIEQAVTGNVHGTHDISAGFEQDWVEMLELNETIAAPGTQAKIDRLEESFRKGQVEVFKGNYSGINPDNPADVIDLDKGYTENAESSAPSFHYLLMNYISIE